MTCSICHASHEETELFRVNEEEWRCRVHAPVDKWFDADPESLEDILSDSGYVVASGAEDVALLIHAVSNDDDQLLCSGYRVFPDGTKCQGCSDCKD